MTDGGGVVLGVRKGRRAKVRTSLRLDQKLLEDALASFEKQSSGYQDVTMTEVITRALELAMGHDWKPRVETGELPAGKEED